VGYTRRSRRQLSDLATETRQAAESREEVTEGGEVNLDDIKEQLKRLEVYAGGRLVREWEPVAVADFPNLIVESKNGMLLWGHELLQAIIAAQVTIQVEKVVGADKVVAELMDGQIEVMTEDETRTFSTRDGWQTYWRSLDE